MYLLVVLLPLFGFIFAISFSRFFGSKGAGIITVFCMSLTVLISFFIFYEVGLSNSTCVFKVLDWLDVGFLHLSWGFLFDSLTCIMLIVVNVVSLLVHIFSLSYMEEDPHLSRFMSYLSLFTFFMLILITGDNFIQMFVGWEGVGLASYLLINFWFTRYQANKSAIKAIIVNRIGDFGLILGISYIFIYFGSLDFLTVFATSYFYQDVYLNLLGFNVHLLTLISLLLFVGAVGKSAQLGLHVWLPDAMEGPTPVSALIHAATMVTAGVFVLIRCSSIIEYSPIALVVISIVGALTAFFAATTGLVQNDLKRVIAYSTCSQLGYMVFACGLSNYSVSLFHLMNHAFFKALLFLSAGAVIHALSDEQDMRKMGGLLKLLPFTYLMILIGSLSLMGFPFLTGYYSKDVILELAYSKYTVYSSFCHWLGTISAFFTAFYSFRLIMLTFIVNTNAYKKVIEAAHDVPNLMLLPLITLCFGSIFIGYLTKDLIIGLGTNFWQSALYFEPKNYILIDSEFLPAFIKLVPVLFSLTGAGISIILYSYFIELKYKIKQNYYFNYFYVFLSRKWFFDNIYSYLIVRPLLSFGYNISFKLLDRGFIEYFGPLGLVRILNKLTSSVNSLQTGYIYHYIYVMVLGMVFFFTFFWFNINNFLSIELFLLFLFVLFFKECFISEKKIKLNSV